MVFSLLFLTLGDPQVDKLMCQKCSNTQPLALAWPHEMPCQIAPRVLDALFGNFGSDETGMSGIRLTGEPKHDAVASVVDHKPA